MESELAPQPDAPEGPPAEERVVVHPPEDPSPAGDDGQGSRTTGRRRFMRYLGGFALVSTGAMILTPIIGFLVPSKSGAASGGGKQLVGTTADIPPGAGKVVALGSKPAIVVNTEQGVKAYSAICTHLGCVVTYNDMIGAIQCPCHDGHFNPTTGAVVSGPPPSPLPAITVSVEGDQIFLTEA
ncbi:MAG: Rieske (2Fe-2S) protein [Chloroflexota bacterium]